MKLEREMSIIEAILFLENNGLDIKALSRISGISITGVETALDQIKEHYSSQEHGIELSDLNGVYSLVPKKDLWSSLKDHYGKKNEQKLSKAALETLSIIAYSQPITRPEIDSIRGVGSDNSVRVLLARGLIMEVGKKEAPGRPSQYGTARDFLKTFHLSSIAELPKLGDIEREKFELN